MTYSRGGREQARESRERRRQRSRFYRPQRPPSTLAEALATLAETLRFTYGETLGKWPLADLVFGINYLLRRQGQLDVARVYAGAGSQRLVGSEWLACLQDLRRLIDVCYNFSKKQLAEFLEATGFQADEVILYRHKAELLKPAFVVLLDHTMKRILLVVRGTHSTKDTLTCVTAAVVPFHHTVLDQSGVKQLVLGYAHCGMAAAARWIAKQAAPALREALRMHPTYHIRAVGHSLGGGTAALLTYVLREDPEFLCTSCYCVAPAACMTYDLAASGEGIVTSLVNGADLVPTFSAASMDDLRSEVAAAAWINDLREQLEQMRILQVVMGSASALRGHLSSLGAVTSKIGRASSLATRNWRQSAQMGASGIGGPRGGLMALPAWNCMRRRQRAAVVPSPAVDVASLPLSSASMEEELCMDLPPEVPSMGMTRDADGSAPLATVTVLGSRRLDAAKDSGSTAGASMPSTSSTAKADTPATPMGMREADAAFGRAWRAQRHRPEDVTGSDGRQKRSRRKEGVGEQQCADPSVEPMKVLVSPTADEIDLSTPDGPAGWVPSLWRELDKELESQPSPARHAASAAEAQAVQEITAEEEQVLKAAVANDGVSVGRRGCVEGDDESRRFFPPGLVLHMVISSRQSVHLRGPAGSTTSESSEEELQLGDRRVGLFTTDRHLYGHIRLSRLMLHDHYMPNHLKSLDNLIDHMEKDLEGLGDSDEGHAADGRSFLASPKALFAIS
eukprot:SM000037S13587  [mRNA]  locus=s37:767558:771644:- [translate_table: standard]